MYTAVYEACGLPWSYGSMDVEDEDAARAFIQRADFLSINITTPYKPLALTSAVESDVAARLAGGANLLVNMRAAASLRSTGADADETVRAEPGTSCLHAYNVDGIGCVSYLEREGVHFKGANAVVCGTGPTAMSITSAALGAGAHVTLLGRDAQRTRQAAEDYKACAAAAGSICEAALSAGSYAEGADALHAADMIIDATSLGMNEGDPAPFDTHLLRSGQAVFDTVYGHGTTALIAAAHQAGARALDGSGMLVGQAIATLDIVMRSAGVKLPLPHGHLFPIMAEAAGFTL